MPKCFICKDSVPKIPFITLGNTNKRLCKERACRMELIDQVSAKQAVKQAQAREKTRKTKDKAKLAVLNQTIKYWRPKADIEFQLFVRLRDHAEPCISCGKMEHEIKHDSVGGKWDGGHYKSKSHKVVLLRYSEENCHKQCKHCNSGKYLSGNSLEYRKRLIEKIGLYRVDVIEGPHPFSHWIWSDYKAVRDWYARINKLLKQELEGGDGGA